MSTSARSVGSMCWRCLLRQKPNRKPSSVPHRALSTSPAHLQTSQTPGERQIEIPDSYPSSMIPDKYGENAEEEVDIKKYIRSELFDLAKKRNVPIPATLTTPTHPSDPRTHRLPRPIQSLYLNPLKRQPTHNIPSATLQLRSFSARNLEFMADFALRAAYYLNLPAKGPVPLPRITHRITVPRSVFVHKKAQENWERVTMRRLIQIVDGHPDVVQLWLAFIRKWTWYGVGMKANVFTHEPLPEQMSESERGAKQAEEVEKGMNSVDWSLFGRKEGLEGEAEVAKALEREGFGAATVAEAVKAVSGEGGGGYSAKKLREGGKVRRTAESEKEEKEWVEKVKDEQRTHTHRFAEFQRGRYGNVEGVTSV